MASPGEIIGAQNRARVRQWLVSHPGGTQTECAQALGLSGMAVGRHVKRIRMEWLPHPQDMGQTVTDSSGLYGSTVCGGAGKWRVEHMPWLAPEE